MDDMRTYCDTQQQTRDCRTAEGKQYMANLGMDMRMIL